MPPLPHGKVHVAFLYNTHSRKPQGGYADHAAPVHLQAALVSPGRSDLTPHLCTNATSPPTARTLQHLILPPTEHCARHAAHERSHTISAGSAASRSHAPVIDVASAVRCNAASALAAAQRPRSALPRRRRRRTLLQAGLEALRRHRRRRPLISMRVNNHPRPTPCGCRTRCHGAFRDIRIGCAAIPCVCTVYPQHPPGTPAAQSPSRRNRAPSGTRATLIRRKGSKQRRPGCHSSAR